MVFPDAAVTSGENPMPNIEDTQKIGAFSGVNQGRSTITGGNKIAPPTAPIAQIS